MDGAIFQYFQSKISLIRGLPQNQQNFFIARYILKFYTCTAATLYVAAFYKYYKYLAMYVSICNSCVHSCIATKCLLPYTKVQTSDGCSYIGYTETVLSQDYS